MLHKRRLKKKRDDQCYMKREDRKKDQLYKDGIQRKDQSYKKKMIEDKIKVIIQKKMRCSKL